MAVPASVSQIEDLITKYCVFWQSWPQFEQTHGERRLVGLEVELIGFHASDLNHIDPSCPRCRNVRAVLLVVAGLLPRAVTVREGSITYNIDSHSHSILCLPALGNRAAVSVSIFVSWNRSTDHSVETDLLTQVRTFLDRSGIRQR